MQVHVVIGASGGLGQAIVNELAIRNPNDTVYALSRNGTPGKQHADNVHSFEVATDNEQHIAQFCAQLKKQGEKVSTAICTVGVLHGNIDGVTVVPEKRLEELDSEQLLTYFHTNTVIPALWLKHLVGIMSDKPSVVACLSARVGSISDNRLGGWYGYRASKAALNMMIKTAAVEYARRAKATSLLSYHPGTVDTALSAPFQSNVKPEKLFTAQFSAQQLMDIIAHLTSDKSPYFLDWDGQVVSW